MPHWGAELPRPVALRVVIADRDATSRVFGVGGSDDALQGTVDFLPGFRRVLPHIVGVADIRPRGGVPSEIAQLIE